MEYTDPKLNAWVGVDPGATGAYSILRENGSFDIEDWEDEFVFANTIADWKQLYNITIAVLEAQHSMPKQGVSSTFKFGTNYGLIRGVLAALKVNTELVPPQTWQRAMLHNADGPDTKSRSLVSARRHFPNSVRGFACACRLCCFVQVEQRLQPTGLGVQLLLVFFALGEL